MDFYRREQVKEVKQQATDEGWRGGASACEFALRREFNSGRDWSDVVGDLAGICLDYVEEVIAGARAEEAVTERQ